MRVRLLAPVRTGRRRAYCFLAIAALTIPVAARAQAPTMSAADAAAMLRRLGYDPDSVRLAAQVEQPARPAAGMLGPIYPAELKAAGTEGDVLLAFVVDTAGHVAASSIRVLRSDHGMFTQAAQAAVTRMTFVPARVHGRAVPQVVQQPFQFRLGH